MDTGSQGILLSPQTPKLVIARSVLCDEAISIFIAHERRDCFVAALLSTNTI